MNARDNIRTESRKGTTQLEREIDQKRHHIEEIVHALESRLSPGEMFSRAMSVSKDGGREFASNLGQTFKANPLPTLLTAAGLAWLYAGQNKRREGYPTTETTGHVGQKSGIGERVGHMREGASAKLGSAKHRASDTAHGAMGSMKHQAHRASDGFNQMLDQNPIALGAMGIAVGAMLGAVLPHTRKEDELMGEKSDRLKDQAKHMAHSGYEKTAQAGRDMTQPSASGGDGGHRPNPPSASDLNSPGAGNVPTGRPF